MGFKQITALVAVICLVLVGYKFIIIVIFFIITIITILKTYQGKLPHVLVRNRGLNPDWESKREDLINAKQEYKFGEVMLPGLRATERDYIEEHQYPFKLAFEDTGIPVLSRQRLGNFLKLIEKEIELSQKFYNNRHKQVA